MNQVVFTSIPLDDLVKALTEHLKPIVEQAVAVHVPDTYINQSDASALLGISTVTIRKFIKEGILTDYASGNTLPKLSRKEVIELRKSVVNGRINKSYIERR